MARDRVAEIAAIRARKGKWGAKFRAETTVEIYHKRVFYEILPADSDYIPIKLVTALEVFTRECVAELVDAGEPYIYRARGLIKDLKFDFDLTQALVGKRVTFGELVSHVISFNSISDIDNVLSELTETPLGELLHGVTKRRSVGVMGEPAEPIIGNIQALKAILHRLFEVRHILVHEMPDQMPFKDAELKDFAEAALNFTHALREVVDTLIHGKYPLTQLDMNEDGRMSAATLDEKLSAALHKIDPAKKAGRFQVAQQVWETFRENEATFVSRMDLDRVDRGSIAPLIFWSSWEELTKERIDWLNRHFDDRYSFDEEPTSNDLSPGQATNPSGCVDSPP